MKLRLLLVSFLAAASAALAQLPSNEVAFKAQAFLIRGQEFFTTWDKPDGPPIESVKDPKRGDQLFLVVFFQGPAIDKDGNAQVTYSLTMKYPNGKQLGPQANIKAGSGKMTEDQRRNLFLGSTRVPIPITAADPAGKYVFEVSVKDVVANAEVPIVVNVEVK